MNRTYAILLLALMFISIPSVAAGQAITSMVIRDTTGDATGAASVNSRAELVEPVEENPEVQTVTTKHFMKQFKTLQNFTKAHFGKTKDFYSPFHY